VRNFGFLGRVADALDARLEVRLVPKTGTLPKEAKAAQASSARRKRKVKA